MFDPRITQLAKNLIHYSCKIQKGENLLIETIGEADDLTRALIKEAYAVGANPFLWVSRDILRREVILNCTQEQLKLHAKVDAELMSQMQAYIGIRGVTNSAELSDIPSSRMNDYMKYYWTPVHGKIRVPLVKWCILRYPTEAAAQMANKSTEAFENYYFDVCCLDYSKMDNAMNPLKALMEKADKVRIVSLGTDISFSIKGMPAIKCAGECNIPDGEIYTAPVRDSVNGIITYNTPSLMDGFTFTDISLEFKNGKIINATANDTKKVNAKFDIDEGARYIGEFAIGVNPYITSPMKNTLFDEKITGSIHFTPGASYDNCFNGNRSSLHWDLVLIQTPEYGGGEIYFDDLLIRKDGRFVIPELECLNPENLI